MKIRNELLGHYATFLWIIWSGFDDSFRELGPRGASYIGFYKETFRQLLNTTLEGEGISGSDNLDELDRKFKSSMVSQKLEATMGRLSDMEDITRIANEFADRATEEEFQFCILKMQRMHMACMMGSSIIPGFDHSDMQREISSHMQMRRRYR